MVSYIPNALSGNSIGGVQLLLAANYESRVQILSKLNVPRAQFAGDTAQTLTDGSYNTRLTTAGSAIPKSATAHLANTSNVFDAVTNHGSTSSGKPMVIRVKKDEFTGETGVIENEDPSVTTSPKVSKTYAVFNADGSIPGVVPLPPSPTALQITTYNAAVVKLNPWNYTASTGARYRVNDKTGEIYVNNAEGMGELDTPSGKVNFNDKLNDVSSPVTSGTYQNNTINSITTGDKGSLEFITDASGINHYDFIVGIVDFEGLTGGALSTAQQQASELSGAIQSLTSILRSISDSKKGIFSIIR
ncbi:MAG: hypothetical protein H7263_14305 [Candidatus Sericytochromatia bacterium]|nr:hypothetical protein [Candidatus Sericytochromatia bacterium]